MSDGGLTLSPTTIVSPNHIGDAPRADADAALTTRISNQDDFRAYLDKSSISLLEKGRRARVFDPADEIQSKSVYKDTGDSTLV